MRIQKQRASVDNLSERTQKKVGVGLLHGLDSNGKKIRKSILQYRDSKAIKSTDDANKVALSKAEKAIADANEKSENYIGELKASRAARHAKMMQRRKSGMKVKQKPRIQNDVRAKQISSRGRRIEKIAKGFGCRQERIHEKEKYSAKYCFRSGGKCRKRARCT